MSAIAAEGGDRSITDLLRESAAAASSAGRPSDLRQPHRQLLPSQHPLHLQQQHAAGGGDAAYYHHPSLAHQYAHHHAASLAAQQQRQHQHQHQHQQHASYPQQQHRPYPPPPPHPSDIPHRLSNPLAHERLSNSSLRSVGSNGDRGHHRGAGGQLHGHGHGHAHPSPYSPSQQLASSPNFFPLPEHEDDGNRLSNLSTFSTGGVDIGIIASSHGGGGQQPPPGGLGAGPQGGEGMD